MNTRLRLRILYALGCALLVSTYNASPRNAFAQSIEPPGSATEHTRIGAGANANANASTSASAAPPLRSGAVRTTEPTHAERLDAATTQAPTTDAHPSVAMRGEREQTGVVNLNTATAGELQRLPRIGPARAQAILALRAKVTRFSKVEQLLRVKGIGRATFRELRPMLTLDGPTTLPERRPR